MKSALSQSLLRIVTGGASALALSLIVTTVPARAQNNRPEPQRPQPSGSATAQNTQPQPPPTTNGNNGTRANSMARRPVPEGKVQLAFNEASVEEVIPFIVAATGKVVMPLNLTQLKPRKITIINDEPIERALALDMVFTALRFNGVGVIETEQLIILDLMETLRQKGAAPVLSAEDDVMHRTDNGFIVKIFKLKEASAMTVRDQVLSENLPDFANLTVDQNSNQLILYGDVALAKHIQTIINQLDRTSVTVETRTWHLRYADATAIEEQIWSLFDTSGTVQQQGSRVRQPNRQNPQRPGAPGAQQTPAGAESPGPIVELRVSVNVRQNSVTVSAEPAKVRKIAELIETHWDLPLPEETAKMYELKHTDPLKVRDLLQSLLTGSGPSRATGAGRAGAPRAGVGGQGGQGSVGEVIGDIYRIEAYPDANSVVVVSKTKESLGYLDSIIKAIDQPSSVGVPAIVELKHANAIHLADELNALLAEVGTRIDLEKPESGLTGEGFGQVGQSGTGGSTGGTTPGTQSGSGGRSTMQLPWMSGRQREDQSPESSLIGKVRIMPIVRQNALAVLAPPAQRQAVVDLIERLDQPGRQVLISAIIAEVELTDDLALGVRFGSGELTSQATDNSVRGTLSFEGANNDIFGSLFDTSVLNTDVNLNVLIQALSQKTNVRILQEPRVFTADNQEAYFFDGQSVPFITQSSVTDVAGITQSFSYERVGVILNVRPRITVQRDVDMEIKLEISSIVPGQTLFGGAILDRRQTTTKVIVKNAQTVVLSGILKDTESQITRGLPLLSDIPLIGELFKSRENSRKTSELIAFITPIVVNNPSENDENFNELERRHLQQLNRPLREQVKRRRDVRDSIVAPRDDEGFPIQPDTNPPVRRRPEARPEQPVDIDDVADDRNPG